jgi:hypothetical protein
MGAEKKVTGQEEIIIARHPSHSLARSARAMAHRTDAPDVGTNEARRALEPLARKLGLQLAIWPRTVTELV